MPSIEGVEPDSERPTTKADADAIEADIIRRTQAMSTGLDTSGLQQRDPAEVAEMAAKKVQSINERNQAAVDPDHAAEWQKRQQAKAEVDQLAVETKKALLERVKTMAGDASLEAHEVLCLAKAYATTVTPYVGFE